MKAITSNKTITPPLKTIEQIKLQGINRHYSSYVNNDILTLRGAIISNIGLEKFQEYLNYRAVTLSDESFDKGLLKDKWFYEAVLKGTLRIIENHGTKTLMEQLGVKGEFPESLGAQQVSLAETQKINAVEIAAALDKFPPSERVARAETL